MADDPTGLLLRHRVMVDGRDISPQIFPRLQRMSVRDASGQVADTAEVELDDRGGSILLPRAGVAIEIRMGDRFGLGLVFAGVVDSVRSRGDRSGGRILAISAKGADVLGRAKQLQERHFDNVTIGEALRLAGQAAGIAEIRIDPDLDQISREYLAMEGESFLAFGQRLAREIGGTFKVSGSRALLVKRNGGTTASGRSMGAVPAKGGENLFAWDIAPFVSRPRHGRATARHYDPDQARLEQSSVEIDDDTTSAELFVRYPAADGDAARDQAAAAAAEVERAGGVGTVTIDGDLRAKPGAICQVRNTRPGIDGDYLIDAVEHAIDRASGMTTRIELGRPQNGAGIDARRGS
ncbi:MAG: contractile injection system protein, VgrG/Pvc8 family [Phenylobacterium sp.]|nr:contractile injection system protein, VgrG/Pvc8 family [Phenylobacterium sp.]